jgi:hypothetical protein
MCNEQLASEKEESDNGQFRVSCLLQVSYKSLLDESVKWLNGTTLWLSASVAEALFQMKPSWQRVAARRK